MDFAVHRVKLQESEEKDKYLDLAWELKKKKKLGNIKVRIIPLVIGALGTVTKGLICKRTRGLGNERMSEGTPNYNIAEISQNTEKNPRDMGKLVITQTPVKDHQLTLMT